MPVQSQRLLLSPSDFRPKQLERARVFVRLVGFGDEPALSVSRSLARVVEFGCPLHTHAPPQFP